MTDLTHPSLDAGNVIHVMPEPLANKIAAGEVVQRPASALKELVENALDAGADEITVVVKKAGSELVQVVDNGCGMSADDAATCFRRHATSKVRSVADLERIQTLGFRGEALASISAVAQVELKTKRMPDAAGTRLRVEGGTETLREPCATPDGTSIAVRNLFYNVPARRNFLKTPATEFKHLVETFQFLALSNPRVAFALLHDDHEVYRLHRARSLDPAAALRHRIGELFGDDHAEQIVPVEEATSYLSVRGFVARPSFTRRSRGEQFLFVNGRYVRHRHLEHAVASGYDGMIADGAYPFFTLFLTIDPAHVDVNVHPTKAEVKFDDERGLYTFLRAVVKRALGVADLTPQIDGDARAARRAAQAGMPQAGMPQAGMLQAVPISSPGLSGAGAPRAAARPDGGFGASAERPHRAPDAAPGVFFPASFPASPASDAQAERYAEAQVLASSATPSAAGAPAVERPAAEGLLWALDGGYILTGIRSGLMLVDQNAAHERVLYERALASLRGELGMSQQLLFPHTVELSAGDFALVKELLPDLRSLGFDVEPFSGRAVVVRGVPADFRPGDERAILEEVVSQFKSFREGEPSRSRETLARSIARRSAIGRDQRLSPKEMRALIDELFGCEMPYACPTGRPTMIKIPFEEIERRFAGRI